MVSFRLNTAQYDCQCNNVVGVDLRRKPPPVLHPPALGSPRKRLASIVVEALHQGNPIFHHFETRLVRFLKIHAGNEEGTCLGDDGKVGLTVWI